MKLLVLGKRGNVSKSFHDLLSGPAFPTFDADFLSSQDLSALAGDRLDDALDQKRPDVIINGAAYTNVAGAETHFEEALRLNAELPRRLARWCALRDKLLIHFSTDYVYDGQGDAAWTEDSPVNPLNCYGESKLQGDLFIQASGCRHFIFRVSWIYSPHGSNFVTTMLRLGAERETLQVVDDQVGSPTLGYDVALATLRILGKIDLHDSSAVGTYHMTNEGFTSWHGFALAIFAEARKRGLPLRVQTVAPLSTEQFGGAVRRPKNSRLSKQKLGRTFDVQLPAWEDALRRCLNAIVGLPIDAEGPP